MCPKILIIPDKFKSTFSSVQIADFISKALNNQGFNDILQIPISDGGDGFLNVINFVLDFKLVEHQIFNARFIKSTGKFAIYNTTAFIESAVTIGLENLHQSLRNPLLTTSYGLGKQILAAIEYNIDKIIIGLGGSATSDGGMGMAAAMGYDFLDCNNNKLIPIALNLNKICKINKNKSTDIFNNIEFIGLSDVKNPLFGKDGAAFSFAAQKGANYDEIIELDRGLKHLKHLFIEQFGFFSDSNIFEGAAGGLGFAIKYFFNGQLKSGSEYLLDMLDFDKLIRDVDVIITGEGKIDKHTFNGKIVGDIYKIANKYNKQTVVIAGISEVYSNYENLIIIPLFDSKVNMKNVKLLTPKIISEIKFKNIINY
ncbi:MAG: glycerate kinase [Bacteroidales bacterium]|nr:glycerate kinase [Bacteroidales bacterium]